MSDKRGRRRRRWLIALAVVVVVVVWGLIVGLKTLSAYHHDKRGLAALEQVKADLSPGDLTSAQSTRLLDQAHAEFVSAQSELSSPLFAPIIVVPVHRPAVHRGPGPELGRRHRLSGRVFVHLRRCTVCSNEPHGAGPERVASLRKLGALSLSAEHQLASVNTGPSQALVGPLAAKYNEFVEPALRRTGAVDQGRRGVGGGRQHPAGPPDLSGPGGQQRRDAGRLRDVPRRRYGHRRRTAPWTWGVSSPPATTPFRRVR